MDVGYHSKIDGHSSNSLAGHSLLNGSASRLAHSNLTASFGGAHADSVSLAHGETERLRRTVADQELRINSLLSELNELRAKPVRVEVRPNVELENRVTVLNTELERVRALAAERGYEIESLREKISVLERQLQSGDHLRANANPANDPNLRAHIENELRLRLREYDSKSSQYSSEISRLQGVISDKVRESETWQAKAAEVERNHQRILDETKRRWEGEVNAHVEKELRAKTVEHEQAETLLRNEIERLRADLEMAQTRLVESERIHMENLEESKRKWQSNVRVSLEQELSIKMREFDERLHASQLEVERYRVALQERERDFESLKARLVDVENACRNEINETTKTLNLRLTSTLEQETRSLSQRYETSIRELQLEIERVRGALNSKEQELQRVSLRLLELEKSVPIRISNAVTQKEETLRIRFEDELTRALQKTSLEIEECKRRSHDLEVEANGRLSNEISIRERRINELERDLNEVVSRFTSLEKSIPSTVENAKAQLESALRVRFEAEISAKIREYEGNLSLARTEFDKVLRESESRERRIGDLEGTLRDWQLRYSELEKSIPGTLNEARTSWESSMRSKFEAEISVKIREYELKLAGLSKEISQLDSFIKGQETEIQSWQRRHHELELSIPVQLRNEQARWEAETRAKFEAELTLKMQEEERRFALSRQEVDKLRQEVEIFVSRLKSSEKDVEQWQRHHADLELSIPKQIESARNSWELALRSRLEGEISAKIQEYELRISAMRKDMERLETDIEIRENRLQSLEAEIRNWHVRYADLEKSIPGTLNDARASWEASMRLRLEAEANQRVHEIESKLSLARSEVDRLKVIISEREHSIEGLRHTLHEKEKALPGIIDSHVNVHETEIRTRFEVELSRTLKEYEEQVVIAKGEVERQRLLVKTKEEECERLRALLLGVERSIPEKIKENENELRLRFEAELSLQLRDYDLRLNEKGEEVRRLKIFIEEREREVEVWRKRVSDLEIEYRERSEELRKQLEIQLKTRLDSEISVSVHSRVEEVRREYEVKILELVRDNEHLTVALTQKTREVEDSKYRLQLQEQKHSQSLKIIEERCELQVRSLIEEKDSLMRALTKMRSDYDGVTVRFEEYKRLHSSIEHEVQFHAERSALETQILQLKQRVEELDSINRTLSSENKLLAKATKEKHVELESLRQKLRTVESKLSIELNELQRKSELQNISSLDAHETTTRLKSENSRLETELSQTNSAWQSTKAELARIYELLEKRKQEDGRNLATIDALRSELRRYQEEGHARLSAQSTGLHERIVELEARLEESEREKANFRGLYQKNSMELTEKNKELVEKIREMDGLRVEYERILRELGTIDGSRRVVSQTRTVSYVSGDRRPL